jgi:TetR/AcrR family transcriptional regulator, transcriptional repressor for nem operon
MSPAIVAAARRPDADATRHKLLQRAFAEIHRSGFRAASLDAILADAGVHRGLALFRRPEMRSDAGVTKGALYHHFANKAELGYAVIDEVVRPWMEQMWRPVLDAADPVDAAITLIRERLAERSEVALTLGCPFNNLCQEMSAVDEGFRSRLGAILADWRRAVTQALERGQARGLVRRDVEPRAAATFVISSIEGCVGMAKASQSREFLDHGFRGLVQYLESLRPAARLPQG